MDGEIGLIIVCGRHRGCGRRVRRPAAQIFGLGRVAGRLQPGQDPVMQQAGQDDRVDQHGDAVQWDRLVFRLATIKPPNDQPYNTKCIFKFVS